MLQAAAFGATLMLPNGVRQCLDLLLLPRLHNPKINSERSAVNNGTGGDFQ